VRKRPALCAYREVYGINLPARAPYWLSGCYAERIYVRPGSEVIVLPRGTDPAPVAAASCSGATAAHALELSQVAPGDRVLVIGPGPLGLFCAALALARGAARVTVAGTERSRGRLEIAAAMGCETLLSDDVPALGPTFDVVLDAAGNARSVRQALGAVLPGGTVALPGVASPMGAVPVDVYEDLARKNVRLQGVWVSDASHLYQAVSLVLSRRYHLDRLVTHRFPLAQANEALAVVQSREALKAVLVPD
jgi:2-desacetyl-2-hydroxyethyl bacteriochlorophyllide A dehydrogenase